MIPKKIKPLERLWSEAANLEDELLAYDFFRRDDEYSSSEPLVLCKDGGLMALFSCEGIDPEPLGDHDLADVSDGLRMAFDVFNAGNLDAKWRGTWEIQSFFVRRPGRPPAIAEPSRPSVALRYLTDSSNAYWSNKGAFCDEIVWAIKFSPHFRDRSTFFSSIWKLRDATTEAVLKLRDLQAAATFTRRTLKVFLENIQSIVTRRPRMGLGMRWLGEVGTLDAMWKLVNRRHDQAPPMRPDLPLVSQIANSHRDNTGLHYRINGRFTKVMTWKTPPEVSVAYLFAALQSEVRFPFTIAQTFRAVDFDKLEKPIRFRANIAMALAGRHRESDAYVEEAQSLIEEVRMDRACAFNWYFCAIIDGDSAPQLEDRVAKFGAQMKRMQGGESLEEHGNRALGELSAIPGNAQYALRSNIVTSIAAGNLASCFKLGQGDPQPFMLFGDRDGGVYSYSLFSRNEPSWNKAVLGLPGSGKSMLLNAFLLGNAAFPSQGYVLDKGNSFGPLFELLKDEMPDEVAVMRLRGGHFKFSPLPFCWALQERRRQQKAGTYKMPLGSGDTLPCPVEDAKTFFEAWLDGLVGQGKPLEPADKNRLDRALKGPNGDGGFFRDFENQCENYLAHGVGRHSPPRPLTSLLTHLKGEATEFLPAVELWTREPRAQYFDSGQDTVASAKYVYFELTGIESDPLLAVPFVMALLGSIWQRIQNPHLIHERKAVIIDEAWSFLAHPAFFKVIEDMFRTIRKFGGFVTLSTQSPRDLQDGNARKLLQTMSEFFLYKGFSEPAFMQDDLKLSSHHIELHQSLREDGDRREVFFATQSGRNRVLSVEIPPALYWFATTDGEDKAWRAAFCSQFGLRGAIEHLVAACDGRTIAAAPVRLAKVKAYAERMGING